MWSQMKLNLRIALRSLCRRFETAKVQARSRALESKSGAGALPRGKRTPGSEKYLWAGGNRGGGSALMAWDELHNDPLSSFVPELKPRFGGVFLFGRAGTGPAGVKPCVQGRGEKEFAACCPPSWSRCPACPPDRAARGAPARYRLRSAAHPRELDGSWPSREWFEPWASPFRAFVHAAGRQ
jgi:hypothetical protein